MGGYVFAGVSSYQHTDGSHNVELSPCWLCSVAVEILHKDRLSAHGLLILLACLVPAVINRLLGVFARELLTRCRVRVDHREMSPWSLGEGGCILGTHVREGSDAMLTPKRVDSIVVSRNMVIVFWRAAMPC